MDTGIDIPDDVPVDVPDEPSADLPEDIPEDIPEDVPEDIHTEEPADVVDDIPEDVPEDIHTEEPADVADDIPEDVPEDIHTEEPVDVADDIPEDVPEDVHTEEPVDVADDIPEDVPEDIHTEEPADVVDDIPEDVPEDIPADEPADVADDIPEDVPEDVPADEPADVADDIPKDVQEDEPSDESGDNPEDGIPEDDVGAEEDPVDTGETDEQPADAQVDVTDDPASDAEKTSADTQKKLNVDRSAEGQTVGNNDAPDSPGTLSGDSLDINETEPDAFSKLSDYMNAHNYGPQDFDTYSQDPEWRNLHRAAFPDYEMPPLTQENAMGQLYDFMNSHGYGPDDLEEYSQNPVWRELQSATFPDYELPEYDDSKEAQALRDLGVPNVDLRECNPEYRSEVVNAVKDAFDAYPELKDQLSKINCNEMNDGTYASYGPTSSDSRFGGCLNLNSKYFSSDDLPSALAEESKQGWSVPNASPQSIVSHELGHGMHLDLCAQDCGLEYGKVPDPAVYNSAVQQYIDDIHADKIVQDACSACGVDFDSWDFADQLTRYGASNYGEALAEAVAEVRNSDNPRPMAQAIYSNLMKYKK